MAQRFGRAGGGNWNAIGTWSAISGGGSDGAGINAGDDVVFDSNSGATFTITAGISIATLDASGLATGASGTQWGGNLVHNTAVALTVTGNTFKFSPGMTYSPASSLTSLVTFTSASGTVALTSGNSGNQKPFAALTCSVTGTLQLQDALLVNRLTSNTSMLSITTGTLDTNAQNVTANNFSAATGTSFLMSSGSHVISGDDTAASAFSAAASTLTKGTSTLSFTSASTATRSLTINGNSLNALSIGANSTGSALRVLTAATVAPLSVVAPSNILIGAGITLTVGSAYTLTGTATAPIFFTGNSANQGIISVASGTPTCTWGVFLGIKCQGGATFSAPNSIDLGGNTSVGIVAPSPGGGKSIVGC